MPNYVLSAVKDHSLVVVATDFAQGLDITTSLNDYLIKFKLDGLSL